MQGKRTQPPSSGNGAKSSGKSKLGEMRGGGGGGRCVKDGEIATSWKQKKIKYRRRTRLCVCVFVCVFLT